MRNRYLGSFHAPSLIPLNTFLLLLYDKICFRIFQHFPVTSSHVFTRAVPPHLINEIRSAHNVHSESAYVLDAFCPPPPWSLGVSHLTVIMCPIYWNLVALDNAERLQSKTCLVLVGLLIRSILRWKLYSHWSAHTIFHAQNGTNQQTN